jgi:hypothetical protein
MFRVRHQLLAGAFLAGLLLASTAHAQDPASVRSDSATGSRVSIRPYLFLAGLSGSITAGSNTIPINSSFGEILDNLQFSLFTAVSFEKGRWGGYADFQYISLGAEGSGALGATVELKNIIGEVDGTFRPSRAGGLRLLAGARAYQVDQTLTIGANPSTTASTFVLDPIVGAIGEWSLGDKWDFEIRGDIGGFGVSSEFTSQLSMVALLNVSKSVSIPIGYRTLNYRIKDGKIFMDTQMGGLVLGADIKL